MLPTGERLAERRRHGDDPDPIGSGHGVWRGLGAGRRRARRAAGPPSSMPRDADTTKTAKAMKLTKRIVHSGPVGSPATGNAAPTASSTVVSWSSGLPAPSARAP
jgi:hypothetical protein